MRLGAGTVSLPIEATRADDVATRCRGLVTKRALMAAGAVLIPVPGLDIAADVALLVRLIDEINREYGLSARDIERLNPNRRVFVYKTISVVGAAMVGRAITPALVTAALAQVGLRLATASAARFVPIAGQALAAGLAFAAMRYVGLQHIRDCERVWREAVLPATVEPLRVVPSTTR
jgi:uncharacterized protein (DUF697 family)